MRSVDDWFSTPNILLIKLHEALGMLIKYLLIFDSDIERHGAAFSVSLRPRALTVLCPLADSVRLTHTVSGNVLLVTFLNISLAISSWA